MVSRLRPWRQWICRARLFGMPIVGHDDGAPAYESAGLTQRWGDAYICERCGHIRRRGTPRIIRDPDDRLTVLWYVWRGRDGDLYEAIEPNLARYRERHPHDVISIPAGRVIR